MGSPGGGVVGGAGWWSSSVVHRRLRVAGVGRDLAGRGSLVGPSPAARTGPSPPVPGSGAERPVGVHDAVAHGKRLNQWAARPAPATTRRRPAAANHWVTSRCSVV